MNKIEEIKNNENEYKKIKSNFANYKFKTVQQMQDEYYKIYENSGKIKNEEVYTIELNDLQIKTDVYDLRILRANLTNEVNNLANEVGSLVNEVNSVNDKLNISTEELRKLEEYKENYNFLVEKFEKRQKTVIYKAIRKIKKMLSGGIND